MEGKQNINTLIFINLEAKYYHIQYGANLRQLKEIAIYWSSRRLCAQTKTRFNFRTYSMQINSNQNFFPHITLIYLQLSFPLRESHCPVLPEIGSSCPNNPSQKVDEHPQLSESITAVQVSLALRGGPSPRSVFMCWTAMRSTVSLSSLRDMALQVGTRDASSSMKLFILSRRLFSIWLWASLQRKNSREKHLGKAGTRLFCIYILLACKRTAKYLSEY